MQFKNGQRNRIHIFFRRRNPNGQQVHKKMLISYLLLLLFTQACLILVTPWTVACQDPLSMGFLRREYWSGLPFSSPKDLPDLGIQPTSPAFTGGFFTTETPGKPSPDIREIQIKS